MNQEDHWKKVNEAMLTFHELFDTCKNDDDDECDHKKLLTMPEGFKVCEECGRQVGIEFVVDPLQSVRPNKRTSYTRARQFRAQISKFMFGYVPNEKQSVNIDKLPENIKGIRRYLRFKRKDMKFDVYYWMIKNNINTTFRREDMIDWEAQFKKKRVKPKDFLYEKCKGHPEYSIFESILERKGKPKA